MNFIDRVMATTLNPDRAAAVKARLKAHEEDVARFAAMPDAALAEEAQYYLTQCQRSDWPKGTPVYDAVMQYVILPELIRRLRD